MIHSAVVRSCAFVLSGLFCAAGPALAADTPYRTETFDAKGLRTLYSQTSGGSIEVTGGESDQAIVEMYVTTNHGSSDPETIEKRIAAYRIAIVKDGGTLRAVSESHFDNWRSQLTVSFRIRVPRDIDCRLKTSGGDLALHDVAGTQVLDTSGGSIRLEQVQGDTTASTSGGDIAVSAYDGRLRASTSGGAVSAQHSKGAFDLQTSGGSIELDQLSGAIEAATSGGNVRADISELSGPLKLSTDGGNVRASVPANQGLDLLLEADSVKVKLVNFSGSATREKVRGSVNGGGLPVQLRTSGGSVFLDFKND